MFTMPSVDKSTNVRPAKRVPLTTRAALLGLRMGEALVPPLGARLASRLFFTPQRFARPAREWQLVASGERFTASAAGERLTGWSFGEGPTVLLVHGWEGRGTQLGAFVAPLVERGYRVVAFDAPAHGDSTGKRTNVFAIAEAVRTMAERQGPLAGIIAHSLGAAATSVALRAGLSVPALVYIAPWCTLSSAVDSFAAKVRLSPRTTHRLKGDIARTFAVPWEEVDGDVIARHMRAPLLVLHDRDDREIPASEGERLVRQWPGARLELTAGLGHRRILRDPAVVHGATAFIAPAVRPPGDDWQRLLSGDFSITPGG